MERLISILSVLACLTLAACPDDPTGPDGGDADADADADIVEDADGDADADDDRDAGPPPVAPEVALELLPVDRWVVAAVSTTGDLYRERLIEGSFEMPEEGVDDLGTTWRELPTSEGGVVAAAGAVGYAAAELRGEAPLRLVARLDNADRIYSGGAVQPGDVYGSGRLRVPVVLAEGEGLVVVHLAGYRGSPQVELWTTTDELHFNLDDLTAPDLVEGDEGERWLGVPVLNLTDGPVRELTARVLSSDQLEETEVVLPALAPRAVTQVGFLLRPTEPWPAAEETVVARLHLESPDLDWAYERDLELTTLVAGEPYRQTFRTPVDGSVQYYGVRRPSAFDEAADSALVLSLHGAGVEAIGQARAYSSRDWTYLVAPTNRRPYGFDWEEWGHLNALASLDDAMERFRIDPTRVYLTGHSMGGHGTWHVGVHHPGRFATLGPSAGWSSFYSYTGATRPTGALARSRAQSETMDYIGNLARRGVYIIHGGADDNVPVREGRDMAAAVGEVTDDLVYHEEPGAGHWWDGDAAPGADCVDWPPLFEFMETHVLDPVELDFEFRSPGPWYSARHAYVTIQSASSPSEDVVIRSEQLEATRVALTTTNVRSLEIDGEALADRDVTTIEVDGEPFELDGEPLWVGPVDGKWVEVSGPFNQVFQRPFCYVYPDGDRMMADYAAFAVGDWALNGNGLGCALPLSAAEEARAAGRNLIYLGVSRAALGELPVPIDWDGAEVRVGDQAFGDAAMLFVFPEGERLSAAMVATDGAEASLHDIIPFSSRAGLPDYFVWGGGRRLAAGFFDGDWALAPAP